MPKITVLTSIFLFLNGLNIEVSAQQLTHKQGDIILCLHPQTDQLSLIDKYATFKQKPTALKMEKCLSDQMNIWQASFDFATVDDLSFIQALRADPQIVVAQRNHFLKFRSNVPNDPFLDEQWQWINMGQRGVVDSDVDAEEAWSLATGGVTRLGDTIVVAVIDVGVDDMHEDLAANIWRNHAEIPGNRIDDDDNGYVDDVRGWNVLLENDNVDPELFAGGVPETHGTEILGMIGAVGNNRIGGAGINWNVKMMNVFFNTDLNEADMIAAYGYILAQRQIYNETDGEKGAFVVATNLSYGDEDLSPEDSPIWCAVYDSLGRQGIINCTATANTSINIDTIRDMPTSCPSDYMISVTATNSSDERTFAAFGKNDIDLAAPGSQLQTTSIPNYEFVTGTSYASPIVAGAIALLYASPCGDLASLAKIDPAGAALQARALLLENVDKLGPLENEVSSGGRLNVFNALQQTMATCLTCIAPFDFQPELVDNNTAEINFMVDSSVQRADFRWRIAGDTTWNSIDSVLSPVEIDSLTLCTTYEYQIEAFCSDGTSTNSDILSFATEGCCVPPSGILAEATSTSTANVTLQGTDSGTSYLLIYGEQQDTMVWDTLTITSDSTAMLDSLSLCTQYLVFAEVVCANQENMSTDTLELLTLGCGTCLDSMYCELNVNAVGDEWIERVVLNTIDVTSGYNEGYGDHTGDATQLKQGNSYDISITPGFSQDTIAEHYFGWIDYNQNGIFDLEGEQVFTSDTAVDVSVFEASIAIPEDAPLGITRLRVMMLFDPIDEVVSGCATMVDLGEAEDFCVEIVIDSLLCPKPENLDTMGFQGTSTMVTWERVDSAIAYIIRHRKMGDEEWMEEVDTAIVFALSDLEECSTYEVQVQAVCQRDTSGYTESLLFATFCNTSTEELELELPLQIYPNPFTSSITLFVDALRHQNAEVILYQLDGRELHRKSVGIREGEQIITLDNLAYLPQGMYLLGLQSDKGRVVHKILKN